MTKKNAMRKVSIYTLSEELGISTATVSRALNNHPAISAEVRKMVQQTASKYNFRPRVVSTQRIFIYVLIQQEDGDPADFDNFLSRTLEGVEEYCRHESVEMGLYCEELSNLNRCDIVRQLRHRHASAALVLRATEGSKYLQEMDEQSFPYICMNNLGSQHSERNFGLDDEKNIRLAVNHLLALGHRQLGIICDWLHSPPAIQRLNVYRTVLNEVGIELDPRLEFYPEKISDRSIHGGLKIGFEGCRHLLVNAPEMTGIITCADMISKGALSCLFQHNVKVPEQISVVGYDDYPETAYMCPPLTTIRIPYKEIGYELTRQIHRRCRGLEVLWTEKIIKQLEGKLIVRDSTRMMEK